MVIFFESVDRLNYNSPSTVLSLLKKRHFAGLASTFQIIISYQYRFGRFLCSRAIKARYIVSRVVWYQYSTVHAQCQQQEGRKFSKYCQKGVAEITRDPMAFTGRRVEPFRDIQMCVLTPFLPRNLLLQLQNPCPLSAGKPNPFPRPSSWRAGTLLQARIVSRSLLQYKRAVESSIKQQHNLFFQVMSTYQSINVSVNANNGDRKQADDEDLSVESRSIASLLDSPQEICVSPVPDSFKNERTALMGNHELDDESFHFGKMRALIGSMVLASLFFGISIGFSLGYYFAHRGVFSIFSMDNSEDKVLDDGMGSEVSKVLRFIDGIFLHDDNSPENLEARKDPTMQFSLTGGSSVKRPLVYLNQENAYELLMNPSQSVAAVSEYSNDYFLISSGLDAQINQAYCGAASVVAVVNSLRFMPVDSNGNHGGFNLPVDAEYAPYRYATQKDIFGQCAKDNVISNIGGGAGVDGILTPPYGLTMTQVTELLKCQLHSNTTNWKIETNYVDSTHQTVGKLRFDLKNTLANSNARILVNYVRSEVGQLGDAHWSPIGSYSEKDDAFLILDVAKYKYPPAWVPTERLFDAMATEDACGEWNYPNGQDVLSQEERFAHTKDTYTAVMKKLGCRSKLRGYIVVSME